MITIIVPEWLVWLAVVWAVVSIVLSCINIVYRAQIKVLEERNDNMIKELKERLKMS